MRGSSLSLLACCATILLIGLLSGCRSPWIQAVIVNQQNTPVNLVEVDYAGGSFGTQSIAPHSAFHYRFHLLGSDKVKVSFTDAAYHNVKATGPELEKGQAGTLRIEIEPGNKVEWQPQLKLSK
jgi:hypothetical protein